MRTIRIYQSGALAIGTEIELETQAATHLTRVLRIKLGAELVLFNGDGSEYTARLTRVHRHQAWATILDAQAIDRESPLNIILCQGISRAERMDFTIQKAVELGVGAVIPIFTERGAVQLKGERLDKKLRHWQAVTQSACEQCGRNRVPVIEAATHFEQFIGRQDLPDLKLVLDPEANESLGSLLPGHRDIALLAGPEGGLSQSEIEICYENGFTGGRLGPRILRTETAALTALSIIQNISGDLG